MKVKKYNKKSNGKNATGSPSKYKKKYCKEIEDWMGQGYSADAFAGEIGVSQQTIWNWTKSHKEFLESMRLGRAKGILFWEKIAVEATLGKRKVNTSLLIFQLKNRIGWKDKVDVFERDFFDEMVENNEDETENLTNEQGIKELINKYGKALSIASDKVN